MSAYPQDFQPPAPPPKPGSHASSGISTPTPTATVDSHLAAPETISDPGDKWLPQILQDKTKQELQEIVSSPSLLHALAFAPSTAHPSTLQSTASLNAALNQNASLAEHLSFHASHTSHLRSRTSTSLLATQSLERQWRARQAHQDHALAEFAPSALYQRLAAGVAEQMQLVAAMEESFLEGEEVGEREAEEWVRRYRDARVLGYLRGERKGRWDEGRVGGWR